MFPRTVLTKKKEIITITDIAWSKIKDIINNSDSKGLLFAVTSGGCNGFNYSFDSIPDNKLDDLLKLKPTIIQRDHMKVFIDPLAEMYLIGTKIDYI